jgi:hypothetical protein
MDYCTIKCVKYTSMADIIDACLRQFGNFGKLSYRISHRFPLWASAGSATVFRFGFGLRQAQPPHQPPFSALASAGSATAEKQPPNLFST